MSMCPRCQVNTLFRGEARGIQLRACGRCRGVWLDADPSARVFAALADAPAVEHAPQGALPCACCGRPMKTRTPAGAELEIDVCAEHGAWFDHEELERLVTLAAARRGVTITPARRDAAQAGPGGAAAVAGVAAAGAVTAVLTADLIVAREPARDSSIVDTSAGDVILVDPVIAAEVGELAVEARRGSGERRRGARAGRQGRRGRDRSRGRVGARRGRRRGALSRRRGGRRRARGRGRARGGRGRGGQRRARAAGVAPRVRRRAVRIDRTTTWR
ncbi:MAG: zf-TFIIB domain-containing protein [Myxococcales bacterium]|nr:zf-TFIIB domain-containing protein [Myxococcales bacterium]